MTKENILIKDIETTELNILIKALKVNGIEYFKYNGLEIRLKNTYTEPEEQQDIKIEGDVLSDQDLLFWSSDE